MMMLMTSLLSGEGDTFFSASPPVSNGRNCCWNIFMSASSPSAFLRPTPKHTFVSTSTTQQQSPRAIEKRRKKERGKNQFSLLFTCLHSNNLLIKLARTRTKFHRGVCISWCVREKARAQSEGSGAIVSKFPSRRLITKFSRARQRYARTREEQKKTRINVIPFSLILVDLCRRASSFSRRFIVSSNKESAAHTHHRAFYADAIFFDFFCLSLSLERDSRGGRGGEEHLRLLRKKKTDPPQKDLISFNAHRAPFPPLRKRR